jgi:acyl carrier protein
LEATMMTTAERIKTIVCERLSLNAEEVSTDASFIGDLGADSLDLVDLAMALEDAFSLKIKDDDYVHLTKISDAAEYIDARLNPQAAE